MPYLDDYAKLNDRDQRARKAIAAEIRYTKEWISGAKSKIADGEDVLLGTQDKWVVPDAGIIVKLREQYLARLEFMLSQTIDEIKI